MKKFNIIFILLSGLLLCTSCLFEQKEIFDKTPAERMEAFLEEYQELLESSENGWILEYYPDSDLTYGGYSYVLTFADGNVSALFQLAADISKPVTSMYKMVPDDGPVLSFDTYNSYIHYFATPSGGESGYQGLRGDTEFKIMGKSDDESEIYLVGKKSGNPCRLIWNEDYDAVEYLEACNAIKAEINYPSITAIEMQVGDVIGEVSSNGEMELNNIFYFAIPEDPADPESAIVEGMLPFCNTPEGIRLFEPLEVDGVEYDFFYFDNETNRFVSDDEYVSFNLLYTPVSEQFIGDTWYISRSNLSSAAASIFAEVETALAAKGDAIQYLSLGKGMNGGKKYGLQFQCTKGNGTFGMNTTIKGEDLLGLKYSMNGDGKQQEYLVSMLKMVDTFGRASEKTFTVETDNFKSPTWMKLTDKSNPAISIKLVKGQVAY